MNGNKLCIGTQALSIHQRGNSLRPEQNQAKLDVLGEADQVQKMSWVQLGAAVTNISEKMYEDDTIE